MSQTNMIRPISYLHSVSDAPFDNIRSFPLKQLHLTEWGKSAEQVLLKCPIAIWPNLEKFTLSALVVNGTTGFTVLRNFLSVHTITYLDITVQMMYFRPLAVLTHTTLGHLPTLRFLHLRIDAHFSGTMFYANSLSNLEVLHVRCHEMSLNALSNVLKAAPNCRHVTLIDEGSASEIMHLYDMSPTSMLAMTLHHCPSVAIVDVVSDLRCPYEHIEDVIRTFKEYPIDDTHMQKLVRVSLPICQCCDAALHYLIRRLSSAPMLQAFHIPRRTHRSLLRTCILAGLPHLRNLPFHHTIFPVLPHKQMQRLLSVCAEPLPICVLSPSDDLRLDNRSMDLDELMIMREMFMHTKFMATPASVPVFRQETNSFGLTGRQQFEAHVRQKLDKQQQALSKWDAGDYSVCTERETQVVSTSSNQSKGISSPFRKQSSPDTCISWVSMADIIKFMESG